MFILGPRNNTMGGNFNHKGSNMIRKTKHRRSRKRVKKHTRKRQGKRVFSRNKRV